MDIGKEKPAIIVEPLEDPFRRDPQPEPSAPPERAPAEPAEPVRSGNVLAQKLLLEADDAEFLRLANVC